MIDVLDRELQVVLVPFGVAAELATAVSQHAQELDIMLVEERQHTVIEQIGGRDRRLAIVELGKGDLGVGVDGGLLIDAPSGADYGVFEGDDCDAFVKDLPLDRVAADVLIAFEMNGSPLRPENGYPARLVVPGYCGTNSVNDVQSRP